MNYTEEYRRWLEYPGLPNDMREDLLSIADDEEEKKFRFYAPLSFGTAGLRGKMCAGINAINLFTVAQATQGLASLINTIDGAAFKGVAISYDCRHNSAEFARCAASVLAANEIEVFLFDDMRPTPLISFAIRELECIAGINITASHNTKEYNGFKAYWQDGAQIPPEHAKTVAEYISNTDIFTGVKTSSFEQAMKSGFVHIIRKSMDDKYLNAVLAGQVNPGIVRDISDSFKVVYSAMHGVGYKLVPEALRRMGLVHLYPVPEQCSPDPEFPSVASPNPEFPEAHALGAALAKKVGANLFIATDPDSDRIGVSARRGDSFEMLSGNQVGALLLEYIITSLKASGSLPNDAYAVKTIVSTELVKEICRQNGITLYNVFTGFKFIGEKIKECEESKKGSFIFGFEESIGYMRGAYVRDKDAVSGAVMICEMAAYYEKQGKTLWDALGDIYEKYGFFYEKTDNIYMHGLDGLERMKALMCSLRKNTPTDIGGVRVLRMRDYQEMLVHDIEKSTTYATEMGPSNVLYFEMENGDTVVIRPSGTEPKIKIYFLLRAENEDAAARAFSHYKATTDLWR